MTPRLPKDPDGITCAAAAEMLGIGVGAVRRLRREGLLVESIGPQRLYSRHEVESTVVDPWLNASQVAAILGVSHVRVGQLVREGKIPFRLSPGGHRFFRRNQVQVVANARAVMWRGAPVSPLQGD